jgi:pimeloyl-ACP methyl ester carboxylesterase
LIIVVEAKAMGAAIPNAELHIVENSGHLPNMEQTVVFNGVVKKFCNRLEELPAGF